METQSIFQAKFLAKKSLFYCLPVSQQILEEVTILQEDPLDPNDARVDEGVADFSA